MSDEIDQTHDKIWYVKKSGKVFGPFAAAKVRHFLMEGKIELSDEVSRNRKQWEFIRSQPEVIPMQMRNPDAYKNGDSTYDLDPGKKGSLWIPITLVILIIAAGIGISLIIQDETQVAESDCTAAPVPGVNWNSCNKRRVQAENANLDNLMASNTIFTNANFNGSSMKNADLRYARFEDADLTYVNFSEASLKGANLNSADLSYAILDNADLRYADLTEARLGGVTIKDTNLVGTIWNNGKPCKKGSIGKCIQ